METYSKDGIFPLKAKKIVGEIYQRISIPELTVNSLFVAAIAFESKNLFAALILFQGSNKPNLQSLTYLNTFAPDYEYLLRLLCLFSCSEFQTEENPEGLRRVTNKCS